MSSKLLLSFISAITPSGVVWSSSFYPNEAGLIFSSFFSYFNCRKGYY